MKKIFVTLYLAIIVLTGFGQTRTLKVATFNIQNFGKKKLSKTEISDTLANIIRQFDIVAVQEISDVSGRVPYSFLEKINQGHRVHYQVVCSERTGKQPNDRTSQEQYAYYYNSQVVKMEDNMLFDDSKNDLFQREPYIASFKTIEGDFSFIVCTVHTNPELAVQEIDALYEVAQWIPIKFTNCVNLIFCGDFNASCSYASSSDLALLRIHKKPYHWLVNDDQKTNLSVKRDCAYDRFVVNDSMMQHVAGQAVVYKYFTSDSVSDHWPVYIEIKY